MSKKPPKHSEVKKRESSAKRMKGSWGKGRSAEPTIGIRPERILIVTEGIKTEPFYFEGFRRRINNSYGGEYITVKVCGMGDNTVSLFNRARLLAESDASGFTQVWVVYDKDSFPACDFNAVPELCRWASKNGTAYRAAWTNEAFELWYVLHYEYTDAALGRESYGPRLSRCLSSEGHGSYRKTRTDMFDILVGRLDAAISNAERLEAANKGKAPAACNPGTMVHHLVEELLPYMRLGAD